MVTEIFLNLPVKDLSKSITFFKHLGFSFNEQFTDEKAACLVLGNNIYAMLLTVPFFETFTNKSVCNSSIDTEVINAISVESREKVDMLLKKVIEAGGNEPKPAQDHGWTYQRSFEDVDGHLWELIHADMTKFPKN
ncbi:MULTISPECIES: VOC family protein [Galbibacter]|uniref:Glyoxalase/bleomycin resistance/extradiol dioxygenase family protein n=1 Tax=Galbibacter pacificus TaxID=2996052 RepID=A0ABT6FS76_9FLAO|nr:VOC family protein [Galbibacter pacificus]MDG3582757.1 glyoxalase/bleomycin resistance/extradiol dioxygenase family protein [Galbibacter pacificus]MDG3586124.1 glyoxalase/bleomycin resistance/extradiol dioxygenase family protein [Galbibacter pacificus]